MVATVQDYIKSLNFSYRNGLRSNNVEYVNAFGKLSDANTISFEQRTPTLSNLNPDPVVKSVTAKNILIATGTRPLFPNIPGIQHAISSDDLFSLPTPPGKTVVIGGSYVGLECGGFLTHLNFDTTVVLRSIPLRGFDRQAADKVVSLMHRTGTRFIESAVPIAIEKLGEADLVVTFQNSSGKIWRENFNTVLIATGRGAKTQSLGLEQCGVKTNQSGKLVCTLDQTSISSIFGVGDVVQGQPELTPVAIRAGELLADRLFGGSTEHLNLEYVPTCVFTPFEYGCVGLSEEAAIAKYGEDEVEVYLSEFSPLHASAAHWRAVSGDDLEPACLSKLVCLRSKNNKVVGFHFVGPDAGEVTQGFALALTLGATKIDFDRMLGIHPTNAESFASLEVTKRSGRDWVTLGGCGGGKCG
eukprot:c14440_g1_i1.p1 GENE.c14440_g1_i1~~c14440_g1_i1.p1  ORF type:complete len:485 (-),score=119.79 c14440_g1_i1:14-1255(-)